MFSKYGDIDCFVTTGGEFSTGVLAYTHSDASPVAADPSKVAVFGSELTAELASYIRDGSLKATIMNGGVVTTNIETQSQQIDTLLKGGTAEAFSPVDLGKVTIDNVDEYGY